MSEREYGAGPVAALRRIAFLLERGRADTYKVKAYRTAAAAILPLSDDELRARAAQGTLTELPGVGVELHAALPRTEDDCRALAGPGSRVRLEHGAGDDAAEADKAYVRCLKVLLDGAGHPVIATHDPRLIEIAVALASRYGRAPATYELQLRYGVR